MAREPKAPRTPRPRTKSTAAKNDVAIAADPTPNSEEQLRSESMSSEPSEEDIRLRAYHRYLERGGGHERSQLPCLQASLGVEPDLLGEAAVVRHDSPLPQPLLEMPAEPLGEPSVAHEHQRRRVRSHQAGDAVVDLGPDLTRHHRLERRSR